MPSQHKIARLQGYHGSSCHLKNFKSSIKKRLSYQSLLVFHTPDFFLVLPVQVLLHFLTWLGNLPQDQGISTYVHFSLLHLVCLYFFPVFQCAIFPSLIGVWDCSSVRICGYSYPNLSFSSNVVTRDAYWERVMTYDSTSQVMA